jgi:tetratricopeptide (TPR) repeat protein
VPGSTVLDILPPEQEWMLAEVRRARHGSRYWEAGLYRLNGELLLAQDRRNPAAQGQWQRAATAAEAEACFQQARETARELSAKSFELRAATSLARLWQQQGKKEEAARCWQRSTAGSPRDSRRRILGTPRRCSKSFRNAVG